MTDLLLLAMVVLLLKVAFDVDEIRKRLNEK